MEQYYYESKPYLWAVFGLFGISQVTQSMPAAICGVALLACSGLIYKWRRDYRARKA